MASRCQGGPEKKRRLFVQQSTAQSHSYCSFVPKRELGRSDMARA